MDNFFGDKDYKVPTTSNYMKFQEGRNKFRVLSSAIVGYEYWNTDNKPVRSSEPFDGIPEGIKTGKDGEPSRVSHFWAFVVYNYNEKRVQILEITQKSIQVAIQSLVNDETWGNPKKYDITVSRKGSGMETEYTVMPNPHMPTAPEVLETFEKTKINLNALYIGGDPFKPE